MGDASGDARAGEPGSSVLRGVVALVDVTNAGDLNASPVFAKRLLALGAAVVERLSGKVTHVVFKGKPEALRALHDRLARLPGPARSVVSVTWVMACADACARVEETAYIQARPPDTLASLVKSPTYHRGGSSHSTKKRKAMEPLPAHRYGACFPAAWAPAQRAVEAPNGCGCQYKTDAWLAARPPQLWTWTTRLSTRRRCWRSSGPQTWVRTRPAVARPRHRSSSRPWYAPLRPPGPASACPGTTC